MNNNIKLLFIILLSILLLGNCAKKKTTAEDPIGSIIINHMDTTTDSNEVKLNLLASDKTGITGYYISEEQTDPDIDNPDWVDIDSKPDYSTSIPFKLSDDPGEKIVYAWFKNSKKKISSPVSDSIEVVDPATSFNGSITINHGDTATYSNEVSLDIKVTDFAEVTHYYVSERPIDPGIDITSTNPGWTEPEWIIRGNADGKNSYLSKDITFELSDNLEEKRVYVWFKNKTGIISPKMSDTIMLADRPTGSIVINNGDETTTSPVVSLTLAVSGKIAVTDYYIATSSTPPEVSTQGWKSMENIDESGNIHFTLSNDIGEKTVYAWFKNVAGIISPVATASITLGSIPNAPLHPTITVKAENGNIAFGGATLERIVKLDISAEDVVGIVAYYVSEDPTIPTATTTPTNPGWINISSTEKYSGSNLPFTLSKGLGEKTVYVWFRNSGNIISSATSDSIVFADAPSGKVTINNGDRISNLFKATLKLTASGETTVTSYYVSESSIAPDADTVWSRGITNFPINIPFSFSGNSVGEKTVYAWFKNSAGVISEFTSDTIILADTPNGTIKTNDADTPVTSNSVSLHITATGNTPVAAYYISETSTTPAISSAGWVSITPTTDYRDNITFKIYSKSPGRKTIYAWFKNTAGIVSKQFVYTTFYFQPATK